MAIIGAGIVGLSIADVATDLGYVVDVIYDRPLLASTSAVAAGLIEPVAPPRAPDAQQLILDAFDISFAAWAATIAVQPAPIVTARVITGYRRVAGERPMWAGVVDGYRVLSGHEIPGRLATMTWAERFGSFVVDPRAYITWITEGLLSRGVRFSMRHLSSPNELAGERDVVVNATGIEAANLVGDTELYRCDGHVAIVPRPAGFEEVVLDWDFADEFPDDALDFRYVIARTHDVVLGGTLREGTTISDGEPRLEPGMAERLLAAASDLVPAIEGPVMSYYAGSRPMRSSPRLGEDRLRDGTPLVHCYGTGGSGWTLAPGLARRTIEIVAKRVPPPALAFPSALAG
jgi:glycine/D-amino acid oxidase-like deaminating enzyme